MTGLQIVSRVVPHAFYKEQRKGGLREELKPEGSALPPWSQDTGFSALPRTENKVVSGSAASWNLPEQTSISIHTQPHTPFIAGELSDAYFFFLCKARHSLWQHGGRSCPLVQALGGQGNCVGQEARNGHFFLFWCHRAVLFALNG